MEMLLMGICISVFGIAIACAAFGAAVRREEGVAEAQVQSQSAITAVATAPTRFFVQEVKIPAVGAKMPTPSVSVPIEALLLQLERHVRLETAAASSFLADPTSALLHSKTTSPFVN
jgi:hypothetical protein